DGGPGLKSFVQLDLADLASQRRLGQLRERKLIVVDPVRRALGIKHPHVQNSVDMDLDIVARNAHLFGNVDGTFLQHVLVTDCVDERHENVESRIKRRTVFPQTFHDVGALLRDDHSSFRDRDDNDQRQHDENKRSSFHAHTSFDSIRYSDLTQSVNPSTFVTIARWPLASGEVPSLRVVHVVPRNSALPVCPEGRSSSRTADSPTMLSTA